MEKEAEATQEGVSSLGDVSAEETLRKTESRLGKSLGGLIDPALWFGIATIVAGLVVLEVLVQTETISRLIIAAPSGAIRGLFEKTNLLQTLDAMRLTASLIAVAMIFEILVALPFGYFLFRFPNFGKAYESWLASLFAAPIFLLYPLFMVIFGRNVITLIAMGFAAGVVPVIVYVRLAFLSVPATLIKTGRSYNLTEMQLFRMIMVPSGAPTIFTGIRLGLIYTMINIIAIEYLVDFGGLGRLVSDRYFRFNIEGTYTAILAVTIVTVAFNIIVRRLEKLVR